MPAVPLTVRSRIPRNSMALPSENRNFSSELKRPRSRLAEARDICGSWVDSILDTGKAQSRFCSRVNQAHSGGPLNTLGCPEIQTSIAFIQHVHDACWCRIPSRSVHIAGYDHRISGIPQLVQQFSHLLAPNLRFCPVFKMRARNRDTMTRSRRNVQVYIECRSLAAAHFSLQILANQYGGLTFSFLQRPDLALFEPVITFRERYQPRLLIG